MKILAIGDVTSPVGVAHLEKNLWSIRQRYDVDFCIVNGENASFITGIGSEGAAVLLRSGADVITGGNHTMQNHGAAKMLENEPCVLRPINYGDAAVGRGYCIVDTGACRILTINALGCVHIDPVLDMPYSYIDRALAEAKGKYDVAILDIHAEATGEKLAIAHNYDGIISVVFGTHTHVPTADLSVLPKGTGYVTDLGMCGESGGILGMDIDTVIYKMKTKLPSKFRACNGKPTADGVIFELDNTTFKTLGLKRIKF